MPKTASVIIRTFNEEKYLPELLGAIRSQETDNHEIEIVIVDSGSTDNTLAIAESFDCRITHIKKKDFTFGRSLNVGCAFSRGDYLIFVSGHCVPASPTWLENLLAPLKDEVAVYSYGKQVARDTTKFSENELFSKFYPEYSKTPQDGYFCNNANSALLRSAWERWPFNEELTGLEDMYLAKQIIEHSSGRIAYTANAPVYHIHDETWHQVRIRYEREAVALQRIEPSIHFNFGDFCRFFCAGVFQDISSALRQKVLWKELPSIVMFRLMQYWGTYSGHHQHRRAAQANKYHYFYPKDVEKEYYEHPESGRLAPHESKQRAS